MSPRSSTTSLGILPLSPDGTSALVDSNGLLKITSPNKPTLDPDYYLNTMYQGEGISDFYDDIGFGEQVELEGAVL